MPPYNPCSCKQQSSPVFIAAVHCYLYLNLWVCLFYACADNQRSFSTNSRHSKNRRREKKMIFLSCILVSAVSSVCLSAVTEPSVLDQTLDALERSLQYMHNRASEFNIDGIFCVRRVQEQLQAFLKHEPQVFQRIRPQILELKDKAKQIADRGMRSAARKDPSYSSEVGFLMREGAKLLWYPSRDAPGSSIEEPIPCKDSFFNGTSSDYCFNQLSGPRSRNSNPCNISTWCIEEKSKPNQRDYVLTHQVLFWQLAEVWECIQHVPANIRDRLCSNVLRDAEMTERMNFPESHADLFLEQIGLCGLWGYKDFNKPEWLKKVLEWQQQSGCYTDLKDFRCIDDSETKTLLRVKRTEQFLSDGCLSHKTGVALLALAANVRFEAEKEYIQTHGNLIL
ncbi:UPF0764 protein C16orf89 homolog [Nephila pilipes]|uniref:UPF0764 protein C16orf89 homolog n=1 Tax=Nephila pilipes TaxID=299642 RepID=A0A8X6IS22_NEPPI|nr:UPF0764 protein C16orf89 homolog [Nephila pilipes]